MSREKQSNASFYMEHTDLMLKLVAPDSPKVKAFRFPSGFGKSLLLKSIKQFFHEPPLESKMNLFQDQSCQKYTVLHIHFYFQSNDYPDFLEELCSKLSEIYIQFRMLKDILSDQDLRYFETMLLDEWYGLNVETLEYYALDALGSLIRFFKRYTETPHTRYHFQPLILVIDEYERPLDFLTGTKSASRAQYCLTQFYQRSVLDPVLQEQFAFAFLGGVLDLPSLQLTENNNARLYTLLGQHDLTRYLGYTQIEVEKILHREWHSVERLSSVVKGYFGVRVNDVIRYNTSIFHRFLVESRYKNNLQQLKGTIDLLQNALVLHETPYLYLQEQMKEYARNKALLALYISRLQETCIMEMDFEAPFNPLAIHFSDEVWFLQYLWQVGALLGIQQCRTASHQSTAYWVKIANRLSETVLKPFSPRYILKARQSTKHVKLPIFSFHLQGIINLLKADELETLAILSIFNTAFIPCALLNRLAKPQVIQSLIKKTEEFFSFSQQVALLCFNEHYNSIYMHTGLKRRMQEILIQENSNVSLSMFFEKVLRVIEQVAPHVFKHPQFYRGLPTYKKNLFCLLIQAMEDALIFMKAYVLEKQLDQTLAVQIDHIKMFLIQHLAPMRLVSSTFASMHEQCHLLKYLLPEGPCIVLNIKKGNDFFQKKDYQTAIYLYQHVRQDILCDKEHYQIENMFLNLKLIECAALQDIQKLNAISRQPRNTKDIFDWNGKFYYPLVYPKYVDSKEIKLSFSKKLKLQQVESLILKREQKNFNAVYLERMKKQLIGPFGNFLKEYEKTILHLLVHQKLEGFNHQFFKVKTLLQASPLLSHQYGKDLITLLRKLFVLTGMQSPLLPLLEKTIHHQFGRRHPHPRFAAVQAIDDTRELKYCG